MGNNQNRNVAPQQIMPEEIMKAVAFDEKMMRFDNRLALLPKKRKKGRGGHKNIREPA
ncbi:hypothetical protein [Sphingorhabdus sp. Alg231-15]|uniref:hypothetical protein n=1 Tax=Sphingorhabdus sp. Alg231-15 TaxID=1922222 RepID=UPI00307BBE67